jgi:hypothetical protein
MAIMDQEIDEDEVICPTSYHPKGLVFEAQAKRSLSLEPQRIDSRNMTPEKGIEARLR